MAILNANSLVKKPHTDEIYTAKQVQEILACADPVTGPSYFLNNYFMIQHPIKGAMHYKAFDYQEELLSTYHNFRNSINLLSRQLGKCLLGNTVINICNKRGEKYAIPIEKFYEYEQAKRNKTTKPDISQYRTN